MNLSMANTSTNPVYDGASLVYLPDTSHETVSDLENYEIKEDIWIWACEDCLADLRKELREVTRYSNSFSLRCSLCGKYTLCNLLLLEKDEIRKFLRGKSY